MSDNHILELKKHIDGIAFLSSEAWIDLENIVYISEIESEDFLVKEGGRATNEYSFSKEY